MATREERWGSRNLAFVRPLVRGLAAVLLGALCEMDHRVIRMLVVVVAVAMLAVGVICLFHDEDLHAGTDDICLSMLAILITALVLVSSPPMRVALAGPFARAFVVFDLPAPPPRG